MQYNCRYKLVKISLLSTSTDYILCPKQSRRIFVFQVILSSSTPTGKLVVLASQDVACVCSSLFNHVFFNTRRWELFHRWLRQREFDKSVSIDGTRAFYTCKYTLKSAVLMIFNIIFARNYHFASHQVFCFTSVVLSVCILVCAMLSHQCINCNSLSLTHTSIINAMTLLRIAVQEMTLTNPGHFGVYSSSHGTYCFRFFKLVLTSVEYHVELRNLKFSSEQKSN